jgi:hypothetical protein
MKSVLLTAALCFGVLSMSAAAHAESLAPKRLQDCAKTPSSSACKKDFEKIQKALEDIVAGRKPSVASPGSLALGDLGKLLSR